MDSIYRSVDLVYSTKSLLLNALEAQKSIGDEARRGSKFDQSISLLFSGLDLAAKCLDQASSDITSACANTSSKKQAHRAHLKSTKDERRAAKSSADQTLFGHRHCQISS